MAAPKSMEEIGAELIFMRTQQALAFLEAKLQKSTFISKDEFEYLKGQYFEAKYAQLPFNPLSKFSAWFEN